MTSMSLDKIRSSRKRRGYLEGQVLVAMPGMVDQRFARSVIYLCAHSREGAMGIVVNQRAKRIKFSDLLVQLEVINQQDVIQLPQRAGGMQVLKGGPVEKEIQQNGWLSCEADADLVFGADLDAKYGRVMRKIGIDPAMLVNDAGHA